MADKVTQDCVACGVQTFERNHFFNGKLLDARDLIAEQDYLRRKDHLHNQLLHGWGTVCGLKVSEHPNAACRDEFVRVAPGVALDCCGKEIVIADEQIVPFRDLAAEVAAQKGIDLSKPQTIYLCLAYDQQGTEEVPALFADCSCDDDGTEPNRIREGGKFGVRIGAGAGPAARAAVNAKLEWPSTLRVEKPSALTIDAQLKRLYVIAGDETSARLDVYEGDNQRYLASVPLGTLFSPFTDGAHAGSALTLAQFEDRLFVAANFPVDGDVPFAPGIRAYQVDTLTQGAQQFFGLNLKQAVQQLLVSPISGALFALDIPTRSILVWEIGTSSAPAPDPAFAVDAGTGPLHMALAHNGRHLYVANVADGLGSLRVLEVANPANVVDVPVDGRPLRVATSYDDRYLYVLAAVDAKDSDGNTTVAATLRRYDLSDPLTPVAAGGTAQFEAGVAPVDLALAPGDRWTYLYLEETVDAPAATGTRLRRSGEAILVPYRLEKLDGATPDAVAAGFGKPLDVGTIPLFSRLSFRGERLYAASGDPATPPTNQIAVIVVAEEPCDDIFRQAIEGCDSCATDGSGDCVILATIPDYVLGAAVDNAAIDNVTDRRIVPSTTAITEVVHCIIEQGVGQGIPGPRGPKGDAGTGVSAVTVDQVLPAGTDPQTTNLASFDPGTGVLTLSLIEGPAGQQIEAAKVTWPPDWTENDPTNATVAADPANGNKLTLFLKLPRGGGGGQQFTRIEGMSWLHGDTTNAGDFLKRMATFGLVIAFGPKKVQLNTVTPDTFLVSLRYTDRQSGLINECDLPIDQSSIFGFAVKQTSNDGKGHVLITDGRPLPPGATEAAAVAIILNDAQFSRLFTQLQHAEILPLAVAFGIRLRCDFVLDTDGQAVDGNHLGGRVPTGNGAAGDNFESWVRVKG